MVTLSIVTSLNTLIVNVCWQGITHIWEDWVMMIGAMGCRRRFDAWLAAATAKFWPWHAIRARLDCEVMRTMGPEWCGNDSSWSGNHLWIHHSWTSPCEASQVLLHCHLRLKRGLAIKVWTHVLSRLKSEIHLSRFSSSFTSQVSTAFHVSFTSNVLRFTSFTATRVSWSH